MSHKRSVSSLCMVAIAVGHVLPVITFSSTEGSQPSVRPWFYIMSPAIICNGL